MYIYIYIYIYTYVCAGLSPERRAGSSTAAGRERSYTPPPPGSDFRDCERARVGSMLHTTPSGQGWCMSSPFRNYVDLRQLRKGVRSRIIRRSRPDFVLFAGHGGTSSRAAEAKQPRR